jgi:NAD-dependent histone deacetylase SIR2
MFMVAHAVGDRSRADLLLVIGTSLQVAPVSKVMGWLPPSMPQILINRDVVAPPRSTSDGFDVSLIGKVEPFCCSVRVRSIH